jgi:hypothetical protein
MTTDTQPEGGDQKKNLRDLLIEKTEALDMSTKRSRMQVTKCVHSRPTRFQ